nr:MAG TPA: hypothetical protein [Bacteriophage sp.]
MKAKKGNCMKAWVSELFNVLAEIWGKSGY